ncbi:MAG: transposase [Planctomycetota bacterium]|nr:transposase [Planctomycetota bacterium]MDA1252328.1 transposase [Planctomycetota bacterium]
MPRTKRVCPAGEVFHVLNRSVARLTIFEKPEDYDAFLRVLEETWAIVPLPVFAMVVMPNHWHFVVRPDSDSQVTDFFRRLTVTHTMRWHSHYRTGGTGHLYQGRFKSFPVQDDEHLLTVMRYVERNPLRANLAPAAEEWKWGSAFARQQKSSRPDWLSAPEEPPLPRQWRAWVNKPQTEAELTALRNCIRRGSPFGSEAWAKSSVLRLGLESTLRPRGRPKKRQHKDGKES